MINKVIKAIKQSDSFIVASHLNPDGDALGSAIALAMTLRAMGKTVSMYNHDEIPETYKFLPGSAETLNTLEGTEAETLIILDCNSPERAGIDKDAVKAFKSSIVIDHHQTEGKFGDIRWVEPSIPATGVMIHRLIKELGVTLTTDIAQNLYTAISLDTGTFRYSNTTAEALSIGAELTEAGAQPGYVSDNLYNNWSFKRFELFQMALAGLDIMPEGICVMKVSLEMQDSTSTTQADTESFVNFPLLMGDVRISALLKQVEPDLWKGSLRSKGHINVSAVAEQFKGGGHINAAGCRYQGSYEDFKAALITELKKLTS